jgi:hypothetical protein
MFATSRAVSETDTAAAQSGFTAAKNKRIRDKYLTAVGSRQRKVNAKKKLLRSGGTTGSSFFCASEERRGQTLAATPLRVATPSAPHLAFSFSQVKIR